ncbi:TonB-dependent receptor [Paludibaculum fermentans]|uniref:TonB-dependent receptor n=1 Tax=Paludibaculum fermentans TaxID=1473598 RepID=A0A7S7SJL0_PALFE|nr:TonB-dependent receptor [Paludibaculum fermentans]QOY86541.1 TonB-dependent receptor [Paludibaculum fermentans]
MRGASLLVLALLPLALAAQWPGQIQGSVMDVSGAILQRARIRVQHDETGAMRFTETAPDGSFHVAGLPDGRYKVTASKPGFHTVARLDVAIRQGHLERIDFVLEVVGQHEEIRIESNAGELSAAPGAGLMMHRGGPGADLPVNGRDLRAAFDLLPGIVQTAAASSDGGQFSANGQRPNTNVVRVDGVSVNNGIGGSSLPGAAPGASLPAMTAIGSIQSLGQAEELEEVELRTPDFLAASGERPGADVVVRTRPGTNALHGEAYSHMRDNGWSARDWFANSLGVPFPRPSYYDFGAALGGPIRRDRTFFFASASRLSMTDTAMQTTVVPSWDARASAPELLKAALWAFPLPMKPEFGAGLAMSTLELERRATVAAQSLRIDHALGSAAMLFARFSNTPSSSEARQLSTSSGRYGWRSITLGATVAGRSGLIHDARFNFSRSVFSSDWGADASLGAPVDLAILVPGEIRSLLGLPIESESSILGFAIGGVGQLVSGRGATASQTQWQVVDSVSKTMRGHQFSAGADFVRLSPSRDRAIDAIALSSASVDSILNREPLAVTVTKLPRGSRPMHTLSLFAQDTVRLGERVSLVYGIRWLGTPPLNSATNHVISGLWNGDPGGGLTNFRSGWLDQWIWKPSYTQFAPRVGVAWQAPGAVVLRAGAGIYYDAGLGSAINPFNGAPFNSWQFGSVGAQTKSIPRGSAVAFKDSPLQVEPLSPLRLPRTTQWKASLEKQVTGGTASVAYVGSSGRNLLHREAGIAPDSGLFWYILARTEGRSNYHSLQTRYSGRILPGLFGLAAYTWSHSIDDGSQDSAVLLARPDAARAEERGSSSFDVRHALSFGLTYEVPGRAMREALRRPFAGWRLNTVVRAHTGFPIDVATMDGGVGVSPGNLGRPDLVFGAPIWLQDGSAPGGRRLNPGAFGMPSQSQQGSLGRNAIPGGGVLQIDASARREFRFSGRWSLDLAVSIFNVANRPAFADPVRYLASPLFGRSASMQNLMFGGGTPNSGLTPLFQTGGPRSAELELRLKF